MCIWMLKTIFYILIHLVFTSGAGSCKFIWTVTISYYKVKKGRDIGYICVNIRKEKIYIFVLSETENIFVS